jgi:hypothetical protein
MAIRIGRTREGRFKKLIGIGGSEIRNTRSQSAPGPNLAYLLAVMACPTSTSGWWLVDNDDRLDRKVESEKGGEGVADGSPASRNAWSTSASVGRRRACEFAMGDLWPGPYSDSPGQKPAPWIFVCACSFFFSFFQSLAMIHYTTLAHSSQIC